MEGGIEQRFRVKSAPVYLYVCVHMYVCIYIYILLLFARPRAFTPNNPSFFSPPRAPSPRTGTVVIRIIIGVIYDLCTRGRSTRGLIHNTIRRKDRSSIRVKRAELACSMMYEGQVRFNRV
jgi:hypothetical protein